MNEQWEKGNSLLSVTNKTEECQRSENVLSVRMSNKYKHMIEKGEQALPRFAPAYLVFPLQFVAVEDPSYCSQLQAIGSRPVSLPACTPREVYYTFRMARLNLSIFFPTNKRPRKLWADRKLC